MNSMSVTSTKMKQ